MKQFSQCAETILAQMGGHKFLAMTGAKNLKFDSISLTMELPNRPKSIRWVQVVLELDDTYTVKFIKSVKGVPETFKKVQGIFADMLQEVFTLHTGLLTSL